MLALSSDPVGIPLTYCGYALLFLALIYMLIDPHVLVQYWLPIVVITLAVMFITYFPNSISSIITIARINIIKMVTMHILTALLMNLLERRLLTSISV